MDDPAYLERVRLLPRPTPEQSERYAHAVAQLHSWYKHLPLAPSVPFRFLLGPDAPASSEYGSRLMDWRYVHVRSAGAHRDAFGHWTCLAPFEMYQGLMPEHVAEVEAGVGIWVRDDDARLPVPAALVQAGTVRVNAFVDERAQRMAETFWLGDPAYGAASYLAELGLVLRDTDVRDVYRAHITREHMAEVRARTVAAMTAAMHRVSDAIWGA